MSAAFPTTADPRSAVQRKLGEIVDEIESTAKSLPGGALRLEIEIRLAEIAAATKSLAARVKGAAAPKPKGFLR
jgi:hypothetical protein